MCRCGHHDDTHRHYRPGRDCGACDCPRFRAAAPWSPRAWLRLHRENECLRAAVAEFPGIERALRLQLRLARAQRDARPATPIPLIPAPRQEDPRARPGPGRRGR